jgi:hypothetical protein
MAVITLDPDDLDAWLWSLNDVSFPNRHDFEMIALGRFCLIPR